MAAILLCTCANEAQDKKHGKGKRAHNETKEERAFSGLQMYCMPE